ncbi:hypothetical protein BASA83_001962 [Batrachochytrium salamandrivorans]|nr:hypothetical protein BASA81_014077 [Batrachochytrium salamandrivorans]KAH9275663.1 hypothetical protein BASA83_001962 [Batrachochytrium salamandrivorans]
MMTSSAKLISGNSGRKSIGGSTVSDNRRVSVGSVSNDKDPGNDFDVESFYLPSAVCWGHIKGYPWWPCKVISNDAHLPREVRRVKPKGSDKHIPVYYFGSHDYSWLPVRLVRPFIEFKSIFETKSKTKAFLDALKEAQDESLWPLHILKQTSPSDEESDEDMEDAEEEGDEENEEEENEDEEEEKNSSDGVQSMDDIEDDSKVSRKPKKGHSRDTAHKKDISVEPPTKKAKSTNMTKSPAKALTLSKDLDKDMDDLKPSVTSGSKRRRSDMTSVPESPSDSKSRAIKVSRKEEVSPSNEPIISPSDTQRLGLKHEPEVSRNLNANVREQVTTRDQLMYLRSKLQTFLKSNERQEIDFQKADRWLKQVEDAKLTLDLFRETKIGKFIRHMCKMQLDVDIYHIIKRCHVLLERWRLELRSLSPPNDGNTEHNGMNKNPSFVSKESESAPATADTGIVAEDSKTLKASESADNSAEAEVFSASNSSCTIETPIATGPIKTTAVNTDPNAPTTPVAEIVSVPPIAPSSISPDTSHPRPTTPTTMEGTGTPSKANGRSHNIAASHTPSTPDAPNTPKKYSPEMSQSDPVAPYLAENRIDSENPGNPATPEDMNPSDSP